MSGALFPLAPLVRTGMDGADRAQGPATYTEASSMARAAIAAAIAALALPLIGPTPTAWADAYRVSGPTVYKNLAVYFVSGNGSSMTAAVPLHEAMPSGNVRINETEKR